MGVMPELFEPQHATLALETARQLFNEPLQLGLKTLSPSDARYRCYYDNAMGYHGDLSVCGGWSYHNVYVPHWVKNRDRSGCG